MTREYKSGEPVHSKRCGGVGSFDGVIIEKRGNGFCVLDPKSRKNLPARYLESFAGRVRERSANDRAASEGRRTPVVIPQLVAAVVVPSTRVSQFL